MYKLLIPAAVLMGAFACATDTSTADRAEELRIEAQKADATADQAAAEADAKAKAAAEATKAEWREYERNSWDPAWDKFYVSTEPKWEGPDWRFERTNDGIVVYRVDVEGPTGSRVEDSVLAAAVNAQYVTDKDVKAHNVDVEVVDNVVHLRGTVGSAAEAREAVRLAINTRGVYHVVSHLKVAP